MRVAMMQSGSCFGINHCKCEERSKKVHKSAVLFASSSICLELIIQQKLPGMLLLAIKKLNVQHK
jgi:hypothetical protein